jgi:hypothetical protein
LKSKINTYEILQVARKLAMVEADLERAEERAEAGEKWVTFLIYLDCSI